MKRHSKPNRAVPLKISKARDVGLSLLLDEIQMAIEWNRPSILLAIQRLRQAKSKAAAMLEEQLQLRSQNVIHARLGDELLRFPHPLLDNPTREKRIYFFSQLDSRRGDRKDVYRTLNLHRETLIENRIRAVFWLTPEEASDLVRFAPDFWSFRHRVVEIATEHSSHKKSSV